MTTKTLPTVAKELAGLDHVPVASLVPFQGDLKELSQREYNKLKKSILENGLIVPFFVWLETGKLLDGHQRTRVFIKEGWLMDVPVVYISADSEQDAKRKLLVISSQYGKVTQEGWDAFTWDLEEEWLKDTVQFDALPWVFDFEQDTGNGAGAESDAEPQTNRAEELREKWGVEPGQLWRLPSRTPGQEHRLICGDCTDAAVVERVMGGEKADIEIHDPPYGMDLDTDFSGMESKMFKGKTGGASYAPVLGDDKDFDPSHLLTSKSPELFLWGADYYCERIPDKNNGSWFIWDKRLDESADKMWGSCFETLWSRKPHKRDLMRVKWAGIFGMEGEPDKARMHPTQKPVAVYTWLLSRYGKKGQVTADYYLGAGSHLIAAENLSMQMRAIEKIPGYVAVALERYYQAFNITPELITEETAVDA